jgi:hypothetical protein
MLENAAELWAWLEDGAHLYVCGDAEKMARDVDRGLAYIIAKEGGMDAAAPKPISRASPAKAAICATSTDHFGLEEQHNEQA